MPTLARVKDADWPDLARQFDDYNYRQTVAYSTELAARAGASCERLGVWHDGELIGMAAVRIRHLPLLSTGLAYVSGGPLSRRGERDLEGFEMAVRALIAEYVEHRRLTLRIQAPLGNSAWNDGARRCMQALGFASARWPRCYQTIAIRTDRPLEDVHDACSKNWRKNLRRSRRRSIETTLATSQDAFDAVCDLHEQLIDRKDLSVDLTAESYRRVHEASPRDEGYVVILARLAGEIVGMNLVSPLGDTLVGLIGATTHVGAQNYAGHALEWAAIELAHELGMRYYDMGGIDKDANPGGYDFKSGTRGKELWAAGPCERSPSIWSGQAIHQCERLVRAMRQLPRRPRRLTSTT